MARCTECGRKLKDGSTSHCHGKVCKHNDIIPRCVHCGGLMDRGGKWDICPKEAEHQAAEEVE